VQERERKGLVFSGKIYQDKVETLIKAMILERASVYSRFSLWQSSRNPRTIIVAN